MGKCKISRGGGVRFNGFRRKYKAASDIKAGGPIGFVLPKQEDIPVSLDKTSRIPIPGGTMFTIDERRSLYAVTRTESSNTYIRLFTVSENSQITWGEELLVSKPSFEVIRSICVTGYGCLIVCLGYSSNDATTYKEEYLQSYKISGLQLTLADEVRHRVSVYSKVRNLPKTDRILLFKCDSSYRSPVVSTIKADENGRITFEDNEVLISNTYYAENISVTKDGRFLLVNTPSNNNMAKCIVPGKVHDDFRIELFTPLVIAQHGVSAWTAFDNIAFVSYYYSDWQSSRGSLSRYILQDDMSIGADDYSNPLCTMNRMLSGKHIAGTSISSGEKQLIILDSEDNYLYLNIAETNTYLLSDGRLLVYRTQQTSDGNPDYAVCDIKRVAYDNLNIIGLCGSAKQADQLSTFIVNYGEANSDYY